MKIIILLPLLLCSCAITAESIAFWADTPLIEATAVATGGLPIVKWLMLGSAGIMGLYEMSKKKGKK